MAVPKKRVSKSKKKKRLINKKKYIKSFIFNSFLLSCSILSNFS